jgi:hypothetical protein
MQTRFDEHQDFKPEDAARLGWIAIEGNYFRTWRFEGDNQIYLLSLPMLKNGSMEMQPCESFREIAVNFEDENYTQAGEFMAVLYYITRTRPLDNNDVINQMAVYKLGLNDGQTLNFDGGFASEWHKLETKSDKITKLKILFDYPH